MNHSQLHNVSTTIPTKETHLDSDIDIKHRMSASDVEHVVYLLRRFREGFLYLAKVLELAKKTFHAGHDAPNRDRINFRQ